MIGGLFAGHDQCGGELMVKKDGTKVKLFYGMSSETAMLKHVGNVANYRQVISFFHFQFLRHKVSN